MYTILQFKGRFLSFWKELMTHTFACLNYSRNFVLVNFSFIVYTQLQMFSNDFLEVFPFNLALEKKKEIKLLLKKQNDIFLTEPLSPPSNTAAFSIKAVMAREIKSFGNTHTHTPSRVQKLEKRMKCKSA